jgi:hypothetical protein
MKIKKLKCFRTGEEQEEFNLKIEYSTNVFFNRTKEEVEKSIFVGQIKSSHIVES